MSYYKTMGAFSGSLISQLSRLCNKTSGLLVHVRYSFILLGSLIRLSVYYKTVRKMNMRKNDRNFQIMRDIAPA